MPFLNSFIGIVAAASLCGQALPSLAGELTRNRESIFVQGNIQAGDLAQLDLTGVREMVFEDSLGGTYAGALHYIEVIKRNDINTVVKGKCFSACALAFLAGKQRSIGTATGVTAISLHSSRILVDGVPQEYTDKRPLMSKIYELTGGKMKPEVLELIRKSWTEASGVVFVAYSFLGFTHFKTLYCDGTQGADTSKCTRLANADPYEMGVLTKR